MKSEHGSDLSPMTGTVRQFEVRDAQTVHGILLQSPEAAAWTLNSFERLKLRGELAWVVEAGGTVCGFLVARIVAQEAEILNLSVDPAKRRTGKATALLQMALADFREVRVAKLFLEVRESNNAAIAFYLKHGFVTTGNRPNYYHDPGEAAVLMMRELAG